MWEKGACVCALAVLASYCPDSEEILFYLSEQLQLGASAKLLAKHFPPLKCIINQTDFLVASTDFGFLGHRFVLGLDLRMDYFSNGISLLLQTNNL